MATYKEIKGATVQTRDEDPVTNTGSWASANNTNSPHSGYGGSSGTYTAALVASNEPYGANVELYDGTSWTETGDLSTSRTSAFSAGTQPATWLGGGRTGPGSGTNNTETFNGSSWTEVNEMNTSRFSSGSAGTYTAGIAFAGNTFTDISRAVETWNGTSWSTHPNDYDSDVAEVIAFGTSTAAITAGGFDGPAPRGGSNASIATSYSYNGSVYTAITAMPQTNGSTTGSGSQTDGLVSGGNRYPAPNTANTIAWDGTSWSQEQDVPVAVYGWGASKATTDTQNQLIFCGSPGSNTTTVDWSFPPPTAAILKEGSIFLSGGTTLKSFGKAAGIPAATWASGGSLNTARDASQGGGTQTAAAYVGGALANPPYQTAIHEQYNGSTWTETTDINTARRYSVTTGLQGSLLYSGQGAPAGNQVESWNGSSWTEVAEINTSRGYGGRAGTQTASIFASGYTTTTGVNNNESWNGSSWTEVAEVNTIKYANAGGGTQTSAIAAGGHNNSGYVANAETWNGTSWTEVADLNTTRGYFAGDGTNDADCLVFGGNTPPPATVAVTEYWNGSSWTEVNDLSTARGNGMGGSGSGNTNLCFGGTDPSARSTATEEFTADNTLSNVTVS
jgi:hypothetical protein